LPFCNFVYCFDCFRIFGCWAAAKPGFCLIIYYNTTFGYRGVDFKHITATAWAAVVTSVTGGLPVVPDVALARRAARFPLAREQKSIWELSGWIAAIIRQAWRILMTLSLLCSRVNFKRKAAGKAFSLALRIIVKPVACAAAISQFLFAGLSLIARVAKNTREMG